MTASEADTDTPDRLGGDDEDPALAGVAVAVASTLATMATALVLAEGPLAKLATADGATLTIPFGDQLGWAFLAAHGVPLHVVADRWSLVGTLVPSPVVYAIPPVTLLVGGYLVARLDGRDGPTGGFRAGALPTVGYALIVLLLLAGSRHDVVSSYANVHIRPDLLRGVVVGIAYPIGFGGGGGVVAGVVAARFGTDRHRVEVAGLALVAVGLLGTIAWAAV